MYPQHTRDPQQRRNARIDGTGLDTLIRGAADTGGEEHALLGAVLADAFDADAVADGPALLEEPVVVIGQRGHSLHAGSIMMVSQPGKPCLL